MDNQTLLNALKTLVEKVQDGTDKEVLKLNTNLKVELRGEDGEIKETREVHNAVSYTGRNLVLAATGGKLPAAFSYVAIGTGVTAPSGSPCTDTAMGTELTRAAGTVTNSTAGTSSTQAVLQIVYTFPAGTGTGAVTEYGLFDAASAGNMLARQTASVVNKGASDTLAVTWQIS